jgi:Polyketide cyclase / dehydrase and lipid transport
MPRIEYSAETSASPEQVLAAATNFTERRTELWPNSSPEYYKVHELGDDWAEVTEGTARLGGFWERVRYDWSTPGVVRSTVIESNVFAGGSWELTVAPLPGGGSRASVVNDRSPKGFKGHAFAGAMSLFGKRFFTPLLRKTLRAVERQP